MAKTIEELESEYLNIQKNINKLEKNKAKILSQIYDKRLRSDESQDLDYYQRKHLSKQKRLRD